MTVDRAGPAAERRSARLFFHLLALLAAAAAGWCAWRGRPPAVWGAAAGAGAAFLLLGTVGLDLGQVLFRAWTRVAEPLGRVMTSVVLTVAYFTAVTPVALCLRALGRRPMAPGWGGERRSSYWRPYHDMPDRERDRRMF